jgi:hypothetical protein
MVLLVMAMLKAKGDLSIKVELFIKGKLDITLLKVKEY